MEVNSPVMMRFDRVETKKPFPENRNGMGISSERIIINN